VQNRRKLEELARGRWILISILAGSGRDKHGAKAQRMRKKLCLFSVCLAFVELMFSLLIRDGKSAGVDSSDAVRPAFWSSGELGSSQPGILLSFCVKRRIS
jgi:hypothetical protein